MPFIPTSPTNLYSRFALFCNGEPFTEARHLISLETEQGSDGSATATLLFPGFSPDGQWSTAMQLASLGASLEVALPDDAEMETVFTGPVESHRLVVSEGGAPELKVEAVAPAATAPLSDEAPLVVVYGASLIELAAQRSFGLAPPVAQGSLPLVRHGRATLIGTTRARLGTLLDIRGVAEEFSGPVRVVAVQHHFSAARGWRTHVEFSST